MIPVRYVTWLNAGVGVVVYPTLRSADSRDKVPTVWDGRRIKGEHWMMDIDISKTLDFAKDTASVVEGGNGSYPWGGLPDGTLVWCGFDVVAGTDRYDDTTALTISRESDQMASCSYHRGALNGVARFDGIKIIPPQ